MSDIISNPAGEGQAADPATQDAGETQGGSRDSGGDATAAELRRTRKALEKANQEIAGFKKAQADKETADLSELDRYKAENGTLKSQIEDLTSKGAEREKHNAFRLAAKDAGVVDVKAALKLADLSVLDFEGEDVVGVDVALKALRKSSPYLFGSTSALAAANDGGGNPSGGAPRGRTLTAKQLADMPMADYAKVQPKIASGEITLIP